MSSNRTWVGVGGVAIAAIVLAGCGSNDTGDGTAGGGGSSPQGDAAAVIANYATNVHQNYEDALAKAKTLQTAIDDLVASPSAAALEAARKAWIDSRPSYEQSEPYRFYGGPIDDEATGPEGRINGWPLDEFFVDYVDGQPDAGIINHPDDFATIDKQLVADQNENGGEKNLSAGYHAIEFLLWGQDLSKTGPGARPFTDYVTGAMGTAANQDRRGAYLKAATELLVDDLEEVEEGWEPGEAKAYAATFIADAPNTSLTKILTGMGSLSGAELSKERMNNAYETKDQEEEHSCFSDTTTSDLYNAAVGLQNIYLGKYGAADGAGLDVLVKAKDAALDTRMQKDLQASVDAIKAIPAPFDQAITDEAKRPKIKAAIDSLKTLTDTTVEVATALGLTINTDPG